MLSNGPVPRAGYPLRVAPVPANGIRHRGFPEVLSSASPGSVQSAVCALVVCVPLMWYNLAVGKDNQGPWP